MSESHSLVEQEVRHYAGVLRQAIRASGFSVSEVERRLGQGPKSLRRVFGGQVDLRFKRVVSVLRIIGMSQDEFFAIAVRSRRRKRRSAPGDFLEAFERMGYRGELAAGMDEDGPASEEEFDRLVEDAVERVLDRKARDEKPAAPDRPALGEKPAVKAKPVGDGWRDLLTEALPAGSLGAPGSLGSDQERDD
jgi:hypothetical protein